MSVLPEECCWQPSCADSVPWSTLHKPPLPPAREKVSVEEESLLRTAVLSILFSAITVFLGAESIHGEEGVKTRNCFSLGCYGIKVQHRV